MLTTASAFGYSFTSFGTRSEPRSFGGSGRITDFLFLILAGSKLREFSAD